MRDVPSPLPLLFPSITATHAGNRVYDCIYSFKQNIPKIVPFLRHPVGQKKGGSLKGTLLDGVRQAGREAKAECKFVRRGKER